MAESSYPFDTGSGTAVDAAAWRAMASRFLPSGVIGASTRDTADTSLLPSLGSGGAGPIFGLTAGEAWVAGTKYTNSSSLTKTQAANVSVNPRIDRLAIKLDTTAKTCLAVVILGTPAASPTSPVMPDTSTEIHLPIARATCPGSASAQNYSALVQERLFVGGRLYVGPSSGAGVLGVGGFQNGDEWLQQDTFDRLLRLNSTWVGTRQREFTATKASASGTTNPGSGVQTTYATLTIPAQAYAYDLKFSARMQMESLGNGAYVEGRIREANASSGTIRAEGSAVAVGVLDAPLSITDTPALRVAAATATTWYFTVTNSTGSGVIRWANTGGWFCATMTPAWS